MNHSPAWKQYIYSERNCKEKQKYVSIIAFWETEPFLSLVLKKEPVKSLSRVVIGERQN